MSEGEHTVVLSDGTKLTQAQWDQFLAQGEIVVDGRRLTKSEGYQNNATYESNDQRRIFGVWNICTFSKQQRHSP